MFLERPGLWPARAVWLIAPLAIGSGYAQLFESKSSTAGLIVEIALWLAWFAVLVATLTPSPRSLTICRIAGPAALGATILVAVSGRWEASTALALGFAAVFCALVFLPTFGDRMINGSAYGSERRMALRPPAFVLLGPAQLAWLLVFAGLVVAPALVLAEHYIFAFFAAALGAAAVWAGGRILHQLARRWIVFVPAGFVIRDPMLLVDAVLLRRNEVAALGPALAEDGSGGDRVDLSGGALGLALEVALKQPTPMTTKERDEAKRLKPNNIEVTNIVFTPTLPGALLSEARIRGLKIGEAPTPS
jgi:hypothetical protein